MRIFLYNEIENKILDFDEKEKELDLIIVKDDYTSGISLKNEHLDYNIKLNKNELEFLIKHFSKKRIIENKIFIYTPYLFLKFLEDKYGKKFVLKLRDYIFYIKDNEIVKTDTSFLLENNLVKFLQKNNAFFEI